MASDKRKRRETAAGKSGEHDIGAALERSEKDERTTMSTADAAAQLNVDPATLQRWVARRMVTADERTLGGRLRWKASTVQKIKRRMRTAPTSGAPPAA